MRPLISELETLLESASAPPIDPPRRIDALTQLAWAIRKQDVPRAHQLASEARALAQAAGYLLGEARATRTMAMTIREPDRMVELLRLAEDAKRLFDEVGEASGRAASRDFLASIYEYIGESGVALQLAVDALSIARSSGSLARQGYALSNVGGVLTASGQVEAGIERLEEALQIFEKIGNLEGTVAICTRLCRAHMSAGGTEAALQYAERCRALAEEAKDEWALATALTVQGDLEDRRGNPAEAERLYRAAIAVLAPRNLLSANVQVTLGRLLIKQGALAAAELELTGALERVKDDPVSVVTATEAHEALAELYELLERTGAALAHLRKAQSSRAEIAKRDARNKVAQVEARAAMEVASKDAEIHRLRFVELHAMQSKLVEVEKMALLGKLAAGTAHELNTPLSVLKSNTELIATISERLSALVAADGTVGAQVTKLTSLLASCRQSTDQAVERLSSVSLSFRRFTQLDQAELGSFDVREGLDSAIALLAPSAPNGIKFERRFQEVPVISAWRRELNQAFMTVLQNAVQAIDGAGVVSAETSRAGSQVVIRIQDSGRGMSPDQVAHLFDVGWSDAGARTQMRMGLSAAYLTVQKHGGTIEVESAFGQGTAVTFRLPVVEAR